MKVKRAFFRSAVAVAGFLAIGFLAGHAARLDAKHKNDVSDPNNPTTQVFQLLDHSYGGKADLCVLADVYKDPSKPDEELRHVLHVDYDKNRSFGKLNLYVRSVGKMTPEQLRSYTPKEIFTFGDTDLEKFVKSDPGPLGMPGDLYLRAGDDTPLTSAPITDDVRKSYDDLVGQYVLPALEKK